jgi:CHRD domain
MAATGRHFGGRGEAKLKLGDDVSNAEDDPIRRRQEMMRSKLVLALLALGAVGLLIPALSGAAAAQLSAKLKGNQEVADGDPNGRGEASVAVKKPSKRKLCFEVSWEKIEPPTAAHIHKGAEGTDGPIKVPLFEDPDGLTVATVDGCVKKISKRIARKLRKAPESFYVNVHNAEHPDGAIRGQLGLAL